MTTPQCAWMTRHKPTLAQRRALSAYVLRQPAFCRYTTVLDLWQAALDITNGHPALIVAILPAAMFNGLASLAYIRREIPVIKPVTYPPDGAWRGEWLVSDPTGDRPFRWRPWTPPAADLHERTGT